MQDAAPPRAWSNRQQILGVLDQGPVGSCVANAIMQAVRAAHVNQGVPDPKLGSRLFAYYNARAYTGDQHVDDGTYLRNCYAGLNRFGFCPEAAWPYAYGVPVNEMPPWGAYRAALDQHAPTVYTRIVSVGQVRLDDIKRAVVAGHCVTFGTRVSVPFCGNDLGTGPIPPPLDLPIAGGHALCLVGYDGDAFQIVNSWGTGWGDGGYCWFSGDYMAWDQTNDIWVCQQAPRYSE